jgi:hypothetical protein
MGEWEQRNQKLAALREELHRSPANLDLANRYWRALAGDRAKNEADYRSGTDVIEAYREAALLSTDGVEAFARAYQELFQISGEIPRLALFDEPLVLSLRAKLVDIAATDRRNVEWVLHSIGESDAEGQ